MNTARDLVGGDRGRQRQTGRGRTCRKGKRGRPGEGIDPPGFDGGDAQTRHFDGGSGGDIRRLPRNRRARHDIDLVERDRARACGPNPCLADPDPDRAGKDQRRNRLVILRNHGKIGGGGTDIAIADPRADLRCAAVGPAEAVDGNRGADPNACAGLAKARGHGSRKDGCLQGARIAG